MSAPILSQVAKTFSYVIQLGIVPVLNVFISSILLVSLLKFKAEIRFCKTTYISIGFSAVVSVSSCSLYLIFCLYGYNVLFWAGVLFVCLIINSLPLFALMHLHWAYLISKVGRKAVTITTSTMPFKSRLQQILLFVIQSIALWLAVKITIDILRMSRAV